MIISIPGHTPLSSATLNYYKDIKNLDLFFFGSHKDSELILPKNISFIEIVSTMYASLGVQKRVLVLNKDIHLEDVPKEGLTIVEGSYFVICPSYKKILKKSLYNDAGEEANFSSVSSWLNNNRP